MTDWAPENWRNKPAKHIPEDYPDWDALAAAEKDLSSRPPLVYVGEIDRLRQQLANVAQGKAFLLQGGDCAESFKEFHPDNIASTFRVLMQMAVTLTYGAMMPVVKVGRIAGQFGKPRSSPTETIDGVTLPSYRGDNINGMEFTEESRLPDPQRLLKAYDQSVSTLNLLRSFSKGGYADLRRVQDWNLAFAKGLESEKYNQMAQKIAEAIKFMDACGAAHESISETEFYVSHEALLLGYEQAMTRKDALNLSGKYYDTSAHMVWIGDRTRQPDGAHVEFARGIENPIGIKCGPTLEPSELIELLDILNPANEAGRIVLIARFGADKVQAGLPPLLRAVQAEGRKVVWSCDPMHGNTIKAETGYKTRPVDAILSEVQDFIMCCRAEGAHPGGVHFEMTGQDVTECLGGAQAITAADLASRYHTHCDPRLNANQALELAFKISEGLQADRAKIAAA